jgi:hypothetical protein
MSKLRGQLIFLLLTALYLLCRHYTLFTTHFGFDDMHYASLANDIAHGDFKQTDDHYRYRWGFIFPLGLSYWLFGVNDLSSGLFSMGCMLVMAYGVWRLSSSWSLWSRILSVIFLLTYYWSGFYADKIMPDIPAAAAVFSACYFYYRSYVDNKRSVFHAAMFVFSLAYGFLIKESIIIVAPIFVGWMIYDCLSAKRLTRFWFYAIIFGITAALIYLVTCYFLTGSLFARVNAIFANGYFSECSYDQLPLSATIDRITHQLIRIWLDTGLLIGFPFVYLAYKLGGREGKFWAWTTIGLMLCANFMSTSIQDYIPLCPDIRHYLWIVPSMSVCVGMIVEIKVSKTDIALPLIISIVFATLAICHHLETLPAYILCVIGWAALWVKQVWHRFAKLSIVAAFLVPLYLTYKTMSVQNYAQQKELVSGHFGQSPVVPTLVISNSAEVNIDRYLTKFNDHNLHWVKQQDLTRQNVEKHTEIYYIMNGMTAYYSNVGWEDNPVWVRTPGGLWTRVDSLGGVELYEINKDSLLLRAFPH